MLDFLLQVVHKVRVRRLLKVVNQLSCPSAKKQPQSCIYMYRVNMHLGNAEGGDEERREGEREGEKKGKCYHLENKFLAASVNS